VVPRGVLGWEDGRLGIGCSLRGAWGCTAQALNPITMANKLIRAVRYMVNSLLSN
jgi:hypothetical protein